MLFPAGGTDSRILREPGGSGDGGGGGGVPGIGLKNDADAGSARAGQLWGGVGGTTDGSQTRKARDTRVAKSELPVKSWWRTHPCRLGGYPRWWTLAPPTILFSTRCGC